jgi:hypothetical protein
MMRPTTPSIPPPNNSDKFVAYFDLREHGIPYTRVHLRRLIRAGNFPAPVRLSEHRIAWHLSAIEKWKASRPVVGGGPNAT